MIDNIHKSNFKKIVITIFCFWSGFIFSITLFCYDKCGKILKK